MRLNSRRTIGWIALLAGAFWAFGPSWAGAAGTSPITVPFDHLTTGVELDGVHRDLPCEACHLNALFRGTPRDCGTCHVKGSLYNATPKTPTHILSTNNCAACHNTISFRPQVHFDHAETMGTCASCHNGVIATGMTIPPHPATSQDCAACHTVMSWNPPKAVDHTQIPMAAAGFCIICHNGVQFSGKPAGHITTNLECGDCHLTTTWTGATFDHTGITSGCVSCHNGTKAVGKQGSHMPTTNLCENCHTTGIGTKTPNWVPSLFDHTQMTVTTCQTCHSGSVKISTGFVSGQPPTHVPPIPSAIDCGICHGNNPGAETWTVLAATIATLHSGLNTNNCLMCHAGETFAGVPAPYIPMSISGVSPTKATPLAPPHIPILAGTDCSACHGAAYQAGGFGPATAMSAATHAFVSTTCDTCHDTGKSYYVGSGTPLQLRPADHISSTDPAMATSDCSACHETKDWVSTVLPSGHMPNPGNLTCAQCHASAPADYTPATLASLSVLHTGVSGNCGLCHGNNATALTWFNNFTPKDALLTPTHIPYLSGTDCSSCHAATYVTGGFGPTNMSAAKHAFVPTSCDACHEAGLTFYLGASTPALQGRPADHLTSGNSQQATGDCSGCHTTTDWTSNILPPGHMPNPGNQTCAVCHTAIGTTFASYATLASIAVLHTGITNGCAQCHGATTQLTFYGGIDDPKDGVLTPAHIPYIAGTDCSSCHASNYVAGGFGPTNMSAAKHAFVATACDTCHEAGLTFYLGASTPALQGRPTDHMAPTGTPQQQTGDCSSCHSTTDWTTNVMPAGHMPNPANQTCAVCHTAIGSTAASYATLASVAVLHTGISGNCGLCHGSPSGALTFYNNNDPIKAAAGLSPVHIPYSNGVDCSNCHASNYAAGGFGPTNMSAAKHAFVPTTCDTCHEAGLSFYLGASTPTLQVRPPTHVSAPNPPQQATGDCSLCHNTTTWTTPTTLPGGHMPIPGTQTCSVCHIGTLTADPNSYATLASIAVLHTGITSGCAQCHGGATALTFYNNNDNPKAAATLSPAHIPAFTGEDCSACHAQNYVTGGFGPMNMTQATHSGVGTTCINCHEAGLSFYMGAASPGLQGRPADHTAGQQVAPNDCSLCHTTANWNSTVLPAGHMPNPANQSCNVCHTGAPASYVTLAANSVLHTGIASNCSQCHGLTQLSFYNNNDPPKSATLTPTHIPFLSGADCGSCHSSTTYAAGGFGPMNMTQATHAFVGTTCNSCHEAGLSFYMGAASPALQGRPADHTSGQMVAPNDCSICHTTANWNSTVLPAGHMPNPANQACTICHTTAPADYSTATLAANAVLHTGVTSSQCAQCHGGTTALTWYNNFTPKDAVLAPPHITYLAGTSCGSCHSSTTYAVGGFGPMNMTQATHAFVVTTCISCHEAGLSFYMGAASPLLQGRPADHTTGQMVAPNDCSICHTTANWNSTALPAGHMPNPGNQACTVCHTAAPTNYATLAANTVLHTGITTGCITCHGAPNATPPVFYLNYTPKDAVLSPVHIPTSSTPCEDCHAVSFTAFSGTTMTAAKHTLMFTVIGKTCDACHDLSTLKFYGVTNLTTRPNGHHVGQDCSGCHNPNNWDGGAAKKKVAAVTTPTRAVIGTVVAAPAGATTANLATTSATAATATTAATASATNAGNRGRLGTAGVSHAGVTGNCASCHNGVLAAGKGPGHIASNNACQNCHTTFGWLPARFDHQGVTAACVSCHNGVTAPGKPALHILTNQDCSACHGTLAWTPVAFSHVGVSAACQSCHNGVTAVGKQAQHVVTTLDCGSCHNTLGWTIVSAPAARPRLLIPAPRGSTGGPNK
ncbi:MAG TPA: cytochrome c3 family protein [Steroidobacteraceae bacterium]|nr:cytochrome c3 family protein [Steroidobacteraceae bacterium]